MIPLSVHEIATATQGGLHGDPSVVVDAVATDSRTLPHGRPLFVALEGEHADGHDFVDAAVAAGAVAVLAARPVGEIGVPVVEVTDPLAALAALAGLVRRRVAPTSVAITGSVGKTTVKDLTAAAVGAGRRVHAATGSFNNELGVPLTVLGMHADTQVLVAEVGARHEGDIAALAPLLAPDVAVVTAVAGVHLEVFGDIEAVARAKSELVESLGAHGLAVLNAGDVRVAAMARIAPACLTVGADRPDADVHALDVRSDDGARVTATAVTPWGRTELRVPLAGRHHLDNALFALAVAGHLGVDVEAAATAIAHARVSPWRGDLRERDGLRVLDDAYNANPTAMLAAIETLAAIRRTGRALAVLGVMAEIGPTAEEEHRRVGHACAANHLDTVIVVGDAAGGIARGARSAGLRDVVEVPDVRAAIATARERVAAGDVVLVKGSRVAGLESVADALVARAPTGGPGRPDEGTP